MGGRFKMAFKDEYAKERGNDEPNTEP